MSGSPPLPEPERPFEFDLDPYAGFEVTAIVDRPVYASGEMVRITVSATNHGERYREHVHPGWQRFEVSVRDEHHREVAHAVPDAAPATQADAVDRWLPGQMLITPLYWAQNEGPVVPGWSLDAPGPRVPPGRYRVRVTWLGHDPKARGEIPDAWSGWFEIV